MNPKFARRLLFGCFKSQARSFHKIEGSYGLVDVAGQAVRVAVAYQSADESVPLQGTENIDEGILIVKLAHRLGEGRLRRCNRVYLLELTKRCPDQRNAAR